LIRFWNKFSVIVGGDTVGDYEVTLSEIWEELSAVIHIPAEDGMRAEIEVEERLCKAISEMQIVWNRLLAQKKRLVILTDMYLPQEVLEQILAHNGYAGYERLMVSNTYRKSKADGSLYEELKAAYPGSRIIHVGDDPVSDVRNAKRHGITAIRI
ncbi:MAG: HAD-IA family hydrolase, partial [Lachnospiraceae bacterium]|nr:HAD-IA family hydrolase [Lachnospiraceae bacterium]